MADISDINAAQTVKITGSDATGVEQTPVASTANGALHSNLRDNSGTEIATSGNPLRVDPTGTTTQPISAASLPLPSGASTSANQTTLLTRVGDLTETAPASDTASSGLNGRLQRIAQRLTSLIALIPSAIGTAFFTRISDGIDSAKVTTNQDLSVSDGLRQGGVQGSVTLTTGGTAYEAKVGGSRLAQRKLLVIIPQDNMFWGYDNTVTTATGMPVSKDQPLVFDIDPDSTFQVWLVASTDAKTAKVTESP